MFPTQIDVPAGTPADTETTTSTPEQGSDVEEAAQSAQADLPGQTENKSPEKTEKKSAAGNTQVMSDADIRNMVQNSVFSLEEAYQSGEYERAKRELDALLSMMDQQFVSDAEKVKYIDRNFRPGQRGLTFAMIADDLGWQRSAASPVETDQTQIIQNSLAAERTAETAKTTSQNTTAVGVAATAAGAKSVNLPPPPPPETDATPTYRDMEKLDKAVFAADSSIEEFFDPELRRFIQQEIRKVALDMGEPPNFILPEDFVKEIEFFIRRFQTEKYYRIFLKMPSAAPENTFRRCGSHSRKRDFRKK